MKVKSIQKSRKISLKNSLNKTASRVYLQSVENEVWFLQLYQTFIQARYRL